MSESTFSAEVDALYDAIDSLSDEFNEYIADRCDAAALNWLRAYGIPKTPAEVYQIFSTLYRGLPANLIKDGKFIPAEGVIASDEAKAERAAKRNENQLSFDDVLKSLKDGGDSRTTFGQYL